VYIPRMWFSENERKGFMACTPAGYRLLNLAGWIGMLGWLLFFLLVAALIVFAVTRLFNFPTLWLFSVPPAFGVVAMILAGLGRSLANRKRFEYDYKPDVASWLEGDTRKTYPLNRQTQTTGAELPSAP
jgi:hypothetical protein